MNLQGLKTFSRILHATQVTITENGKMKQQERIERFKELITSGPQ
jgi:hypothetical protein